MVFIFILHLVISSFMTGVVWFVQLVHYPTLVMFDKNQFAVYNVKNFKPTTFITFPFMLLELISGAWLLIDKHPTELSVYFAINLTFIIMIWASTMFLQVPIHFKISKYPSKPLVERLIKTNWIRTALWSVKLTLLIYILTTIILSKWTMV